MIAILKTIHLLALVFGAAASLGNIYLMFAIEKHDLGAPGFTNRLRKMYRLTALGAIILLWVTGLALVFSRHGLWIPGYAFNMKVTLAAFLTLIIVYLNLMAPGWARRGGPPAHVAALHYAGAFLLLLTVIFAGAAFG